ncbi:MAG: hypothetical protein OEM82_09775, partial [Acidobacteriota bacterium]|nr:hypothetical protein [Acidobacteriota bacterium]
NERYGKSLEGIHNGVLFLAGNEVAIEGGNRFLVVEGFPGLAEATRLPIKDFLEKARTPERLALITHPENGDMNNSADGFEAFSLHNSANEMSKPAFFADAIWSLPGYPALTFLRHFKRPNEALRQFDQISLKRRISLFSGTDAHANIGFQIGGDTENPGFELIIDPYEMTFGIVRTHILLEEPEKLTKEAVLETIRAGRCFIGLDRLGTTRGFMFEAVAGDNRWIMGDEAGFADGLKLKASAPHKARYVVFRNGEKFHESAMTKRVELDLKMPGVYRVELYRDDLGSPFESLPWIISNPVYIR